MKKKMDKPEMKSDDEDEDDMEKGEGMGGKNDKAAGAEKDPKEMERDEDMGKSLDRTIEFLEGLAAKQPSSPVRDLMAKGAQQELSADEAEALIKALSADRPASLVDDVRQTMAGGDDLQKSLTLDVSGYLDGLHGGVVDSLSLLADRLEKGLQAQDESGQVLAKALLDVCQVQQAQAQLLKGLSAQIQRFGAQPTQNFKSAVTQRQAEALHKSFGPTGSEQPRISLSKSDILDTLSEMSLHKSYADQSEALGLALAQYEATNELDPGILRQVLAHRKAGQ